MKLINKQIGHYVKSTMTWFPYLLHNRSGTELRSKVDVRFNHELSWDEFCILQHVASFYERFISTNFIKPILDTYRIGTVTEISVRTQRFNARPEPLGYTYNRTIENDES